MKRVLLVDDNYEFLKILTIALSKYFEIYTATGVSEAIKLIEKTDIDLICSDLDMGEATGIDLLRMVRKNNNDILFILLSGTDRISDVKTAEAYGAKFVSKGESNIINKIVTIAYND